MNVNGNVLPPLSLLELANGKSQQDGQCKRLCFSLYKKLSLWTWLQACSRSKQHGEGDDILVEDGLWYHVRLAAVNNDKV